MYLLSDDQQMRVKCFYIHMEFYVKLCGRIQYRKGIL